MTRSPQDTDTVSPSMETHTCPPYHTLRRGNTLADQSLYPEINITCIISSDTFNCKQVSVVSGSVAVVLS